MSEKNKKVNGEEQDLQEGAIKETIIGFVSEEKEEKTQEQEILEYQEKKKKIDLKNLTEEEIKKVKEKETEEEERLKRIKQELLHSLKVRVPEIEKAFGIQEKSPKKENVKEKVKVEQREGQVQKKRETSSSSGGMQKRNEGPQKQEVQEEQDR